MIYPCIDCKDRYPCCHDHCERYKTASEKNEKFKQAVKEDHVFTRSYLPKGKENFVRNDARRKK